MKKPKKIKVNYDENSYLIGHYYANPNSEKGVIIFPGTAGFKKGFEELGKVFMKDFSVWIFDINSHGESTGHYTTEDVVKAFDKSSQYCKKKCKNLYAIGHSMGALGIGFVAAKYPKRFKKICLISPPIDLQMLPLLKLLKHGLKIPESIIHNVIRIIDTIAKLTNRKYRKLSKERLKTGEAYVAGLRFHKTKDCFKQLQKSPALIKKATKIKNPSLIIYGSRDLIINYKKFKPKYHTFFKNINSKKKKMIIVKGADHNLNRFTNIEGPFNTPKKFQWVKKEIANFFQK